MCSRDLCTPALVSCTCQHLSVNAQAITVYVRTLIQRCISFKHHLCLHKQREVIWGSAAKSRPAQWNGHELRLTRTFAPTVQPTSPQANNSQTNHTHEVLTEVVTKSTIFWDTMPCSPLEDVSGEHITSIFRVERKNKVSKETSVKAGGKQMEAICSSELSVDTKRTARRCILEDRTLQTTPRSQQMPVMSLLLHTHSLYLSKMSTFTC
jgi:hypothetical protein